MNTLAGEIIDTKTADEISLVKVRCGQVIFTSLVMGKPSGEPFFSVGEKVDVHFKESEVIIALPGPLDISVQNRIPARIKKIEEGRILCQLSLIFEGMEINSIITGNAVKQLSLTAGKEVIALIKTNEVSLSYHH